MQHLAAMFAAMFAAAWCRTDLCLGRLKFISVERCCRLGPSSAREQHGEQHGAASAAARALVSAAAKRKEA